MDKAIIPQSLGAEIPDHLAIVHAMGHFAALLLTVLNREKAVNIRKFADHLAVFACITDESERSAGLILAYWAGVIKEAADQYDEHAGSSDAGPGPTPPTHAPGADSPGSVAG